MKTKIPVGKQFDNLQIESLKKIIEKQKESKELDRSQFNSLLLQTFLNNCIENKLYKKTPRVFWSLSIFYVQTAIAFKSVFGDLNVEVWEFCHYLKNNTMFCPEIYETKYTAFDVDASEASRILKSLGYKTI